MTKAAREVLRDIAFAAFVDTVQAMKKGRIDNEVLREVKAIHSNTVFADLPEDVQNTLNSLSFNAFIKLNAAGYEVVSK